MSQQDTGLVQVPWNGENWTRVGDSSMTEPAGLSFVLLTGDEQGGSYFAVEDIRQWSKGDFHSLTAFVEKRQSVLGHEQQLMTALRQLSVIVRDCVVDAKGA